MKSVDPREYPANREWDDKVSTMPNLPRGDEGLISVLRKILTMVKEKKDKNLKLTFSGSNSHRSLDELCVRLHPMRLVKKSVDGWELPPYSLKWLETQDDLFLAAVLCANVRFLAEILFYLDTSRTAAELQEIAISEYDMNWKTLSPLNSRLLWLRQFDLVDFQYFSLKYSLTERGKSFLEAINVVNPSEIIRQSDETSEEKIVDIQEWARVYCEESKSALKKVSLGYYPGRLAQIDKILSTFLSLIQNGAEYEEIINYAINNYNISNSSIKSFISNLLNLGFVTRKTDAVFEMTELGIYWLEKRSLVDLVVCLQAKYYFIFDMLNEMKDTPLSYRELAAQAKIIYGFPKENVEEIRKRITIFKSAKLVMNASVDKYILTNRGKKLLELFPTLVKQKKDPVNLGLLEIVDSVEDLLGELRLASKDSSNPVRFEKAVKIAMEELGFKADLLGGSGKTDVLLKVHGIPEYSFTVAVEVKSTATGSINDNLVDFDTLKEHKKKHHADFVAIVGCAFQNDRLVKRAIEHGVVLLDVDVLETLIKNHKEVPLRSVSYRKIFEQSGVVDITVLDKEREKTAHSGILLKAVMECLIKESEDEVFQGLVQEKDIYRSLRDNERFQGKIELSEITEMLAFLSSPLIGCVGREKNHYYVIGSLEDAERKFAFFARACNEK